MNADPASGALSAFLRGVERRAAVFAELQTGDAGRGDAAVAAAVERFAGAAGALPMAAWPARFWSTLLGEPALASRTALALPLARGDVLAELPAGPRAAVLLRLAAGLDDATAAAALGVAEGAFRLALGQATRADGPIADAEAWRRLHEHVQRRVQALPPHRLQALAGVRAARTGEALPPAWRPPPPPPRRGLRAALWAGVALCALALAATFWPPLRDRLVERLDPDAGVRTEPLPAAGPARVALTGDAALIAHPDHALLLDAGGEQEARSLDFDAWLAAQAAIDRPAPVALVQQAPDDAVAPDAGGDAP